MEKVEENTSVMPVTGASGSVLKEMLKGRDETLLACIETATECHRICVQTITHCLQKGGAHAEILSVQLLQDAAQISNVAADFMLRASSDHRIICGACAEVCRRTASEIEKLVSMDDSLRPCIEVCIRCAASCEDMAKGPQQHS